MSTQVEITAAERTEIRAECRDGDYHGDRERRLLDALERAEAALAHKEAEADLWRARAQKAETVVVPQQRAEAVAPFRLGRVQ